jgi:hypothetical protein
MEKIFKPAGLGISVLQGRREKSIKTFNNILGMK